MRGRGRPLRFVALVACGWAGARIVMLWPEDGSLSDAVEAAFPLRPAEAATPRMPRGVQPATMAIPAPVNHVRTRPAAPVPEPPHPFLGDPVRINLAALGLISFGREEALGVPTGALPSHSLPPAMLPEDARPARWSASAWFVTRRGAAAGGPVLGGDRAGVRVAYHPGSGRLALFTRAATPLAGPGKELAAGIDWQPFAAPIRVVAEYRAGLDGAPGGPALGIVAGIHGVPLPLDFNLEAYGQAGAVARRRVDPFADGALRVTREVAKIGDARLDLGAGAWGAAQREAARLDVGPSAVATVPVGGNAVRLAIDWRERIAGGARPGSGPALSLGADF